MREKLDEWIQENLLQVKWENDLSFSIDDKLFLYIRDRKRIISQDEFSIDYSDVEIQLLEQNEYDYVAFQFGERFYYSPITTTLELNELRYLGLSGQESITPPFLGVHGGYELGNGSRSYSDWVKKAKFLGIETLGICEKNTLAGTLLFQLACQKEGIKPIIGETVTVRRGTEQYDIKLYVETDQGWRNLLKIHRRIRIDNHESRTIKEEELFKYTAGLICVIPTGQRLTDEFVGKYKQAFINLYYQLDPAIYRSPEKDKQQLLMMKRYLDHYANKISPLIIPDAYYLNKGDGHIKKMLNSMVKVTSDYSSYDQYFKPWTEVIGQLSSLFKKEDERRDRLFHNAFTHALHLEKMIEFTIPINKLHLPKYELTEEEALEYKDAEELFWDLIKVGISKYLPEDYDKDLYLNRIETEWDIISRGGFLDYFLILWDIVKWSNENGILTGVGRGSAGGSLIAFLLGITQLDPIKYGLLFERFLNEGRIGKSLPDIDTDFMGSRRDEVKQYMRDRYGFDNVCLVGTYTTFAVRGALKDLSRLKGINFNEANYVSGALEESHTSMADVFREAQEKSVVKDFIKSNHDIFEDMPLILNQPKTESIHAAAVIITPKEDENGRKMRIYDWMPVKMMNGVLVSEWEGPVLETAGFLKEDILGIKQLDKLKSIYELMKSNGKEPMTFHKIQEEGCIDDPDVYELFHQGHNQDLFHFGSVGLTGYSQEVMPENIEDLIAMIALYRPGAMESMAHKTFVDIRKGKTQPEYDFMLDEVTKDTEGLYIYQEQVMKAVQVLGGFNLTEADGIRKAMGKKIRDKMDSYKVQFIKHATEVNNCPIDQAESIWSKLERFAGYGFNKSHAAAYSITGYACQYLKSHHPVEFWTTSLQFANDDELPYRINEIYDLGGHIKLMTPDINESVENFTPDFESKTIYWSFGKIPHIGPAALTAIIEEREKNGKFYSLEEFRERRVPGRKVKRTGLANLILAGAFDRMYSIEKPHQRIQIMEDLYFKILDEEMPAEYTSEDDDFWILQQRNLTGLGYFNYRKMVEEATEGTLLINAYKEAKRLQEQKADKKTVVVMAGILDKIIKKKKRNGEPYAQLIIDNNNHLFEVTVWTEEWYRFKNLLEDAVNKAILVKGKLHYDHRYLHRNVVWLDQESKVQLL